MATIRLYTTALEHQTTRTITHRHYKSDIVTGANVKAIVRTELAAYGDVTVARIVEDDGAATAFMVDSIVTDSATEFTLSLLPKDAARIVEAVLAKPAPVTRDINYHINVSSIDDVFESERIARMRYVRDGIRDSAETVQAKARADRIAAAEKAVRVADMHREAAYQRLRNMPWSTLRWNDPRGIADALSRETRRVLDRAHKDKVAAVLEKVYASQAGY